MKRHTVSGLLIYLSAMVAIVLLNEFTETVSHPLHLSLLGLLMWGVSLLVFHLTAKAAEKSSGRFPSYFMAINGLKMLFYLIVIGLYAFLLKQEAIPFVITFLLLYFAYTTLEVISALSHLKDKT